MQRTEQCYGTAHHFSIVTFPVDACEGCPVTLYGEVRLLMIDEEKEGITFFGFGPAEHIGIREHQGNGNLNH